LAPGLSPILLAVAEYLALSRSLSTGSVGIESP
jgi:hypothetical protein